MTRRFEGPEPKVYILVILICVGLAYLFLLQEMGRLKPFHKDPGDYASCYADGWQGRIDSEKRLYCMNTGIRAITGFDPDHPVDANVAFNIYHDCLKSAGL